MNTSTVIGIIIAILIIGGGAWYLMQDQGIDTGLPGGNGTSTPTGGTSTTTGTGTSTATSTSGTATTTTVTYSASGFSPASITVKTGSTVRFVNQSGSNMWVASDIHPSHSLYAGTTLRDHCPDTSGTAFDQCAAGNEYTFTFTKAGTWKYHNHVNAADTGTVIVSN